MSPERSARRVLLAGILAFILGAGISPVTPPQVAGADPPAIAAAGLEVIDVAAGGWHTCAIRPDGTILCWGDDEEGQATPPDGAFVEVSAGSMHTCARRADGGVECWGEGADGQLTPPGGTYTAISVGYGFTCAIAEGGGLVCWGFDDWQQATPPAGAYMAVSAGEAHACAITAAGSIDCWGANEDGQTTVPSGTFTAVSAGAAHTCAIRADGTLVCWGFNEDGRASPPAGTFTAVAAGGDHSCGIRTDGTIACWGNNDEGILAPPDGTFGAIDAGYMHTCAIRTDDVLECWGNDSSGQVTPHPSAVMGPVAPWSTTTTATLTWEGRPVLAPIASYDVQYRRARYDGTWGSWTTWLSRTTDTEAPFTMSAGYTYCFEVRARDTDDRVSDWSDQGCTAVPLDDRSLTRSGTWSAGTNADYYKGTYLRSYTSGARLTRTGLRTYWLALVATTCPTCGSVKVSFKSTAGWTDTKTVSLASPTTIVRKLIPILDMVDDESVAVGTLTITVGSGGKKVLIDGLLNSRVDAAPSWADSDDPPLPAFGGSTHQVSSASAGYDNSCALKADGTAACWGSNYDGKSVAPAGSFTAIDAGLDHSCAIRSDGTLTCWGSNEYGDTESPDGTFTTLSGSCAIRTDGTVACWGETYEYEEAAPPDGTFTALSADVDGACGVRTDGTIACWGWLNYPALAGTFESVSVGWAHACAVRTDKTLACWGYDDVGQASPPDGTFTAVSVGLWHSCGIRTDGTVACWGSNEYLEGTLPAGTYTSISAGAHHTCGVRTDGTLACSGHNRSGQVTPVPMATMTPLATYLATSDVALEWRGTSLADIASYDVRYRRAKWNGTGYGAWTTWRSATTDTSGTLVASPGYTYCFATRARDGDGTVTAYTTSTCTAVPLDDRSLARSSGWTAKSDAAFYKSTYLESSTSGAKLTLTGVVAKRIGLVATTCPTCGSVKVYWGSTLLKSVSLYSATQVDRQVIHVKELSALKTGTLSIKVSTSGKPVYIDGVAIRRN